MSLTEGEQRQLDDAGYLLLPGFMDADLLTKLRRQIDRVFAAEGDCAGSEFKQEPGCRRLANVVNKGNIFREVIGLPRLLEYVAHVLGPAFKLSSLNVRSVNPNGSAAQPLHADMAAVADERGYWVCNLVWVLDDFTSENGSLRVVPGSHRWRTLPQHSLPDPTAPHPDEVLITGRAGDIIVLNAHTWHGGTANRTGSPRTALHAFYCRRDKPQQQYQKRLLDPAVQQSLSPSLRELLALDDPFNDELSADVAVRSGFLK
jgi:hypothetical protein